MKSLPDQILAVIPEQGKGYIALDSLQQEVNGRRARESSLRYICLGWIRGVSRKSILDKLEPLISNGLVLRDARRTVAVRISSICTEPSDHFCKVTQKKIDAKQEDVSDS